MARFFLLLFLLDEGSALLGVDELIRILNLPGRKALYSRIRRGTAPPPVRIGSSLRWFPTEVADWLKDRQDVEVDG